MEIEHPGGSIDFLGKSFACDEAALTSENPSTLDLVVKASPNLVLQWKNFDRSVLGEIEDDYTFAQSEEAGSPAALILDGFEYPILRARLRSISEGNEVTLEMEGTAESVEYEGCDEVAKPVPFKAVFKLAPESL